MRKRQALFITFIFQIFLALGGYIVFQFYMHRQRIYIEKQELELLKFDTAHSFRNGYVRVVFGGDWIQLNIMDINTNLTDVLILEIFE